MHQHTRLIVPLPVVKYVIASSDENHKYFVVEEDQRSFVKAQELVNRLRLDFPDIEYVLYAELEV